jgi:hypothetical protein
MSWNYHDFTFLSIKKNCLDYSYNILYYVYSHVTLAPLCIYYIQLLSCGYVVLLYRVRENILVIYRKNA